LLSQTGKFESVTKQHYANGITLFESAASKQMGCTEILFEDHNGGLLEDQRQGDERRTVTVGCF
jgi:hypothetical protein